MARFPVLTRSVLSTDQQDLWDEIVHGPRGFYSGGPETAKLPDLYNAYLYFPELGRSCFRIAEKVKASTNISGAMREIVVLTVSKSMGTMVEFDFHVPFARDEGLSDCVIEALRSGAASPDFDDEGEQLVHSACLQLLSSATLEDELSEKLVATIGHEGMMELIAGVSIYTMVAYISNVAKVALADDFSADPQDLSRFFTGKDK